MMLISSERHTEADLRLWRNLEISDRLHFKCAGVERKSVRAVRAIALFAEVQCYASVSWGKDSTVLAHLCWLVGVPLVHVVQIPTGNPHNPQVRDAFLSRFDVTYCEMFADYRGDPRTPIELSGKSDEIFYGCFKAVGIPRYISGIRKNESRVRLLRVMRWGIETKHTLAPLSHWTAQDVFAYLAKHDLPTHPNYAMLGDGMFDRNHVRVDEIGGYRGTNMGRGAWERMYYPEMSHYRYA